MQPHCQEGPVKLPESTVHGRRVRICFHLLSMQVSVVGVVREFVPFVTSIKYSVDDMTGPPMDVKQWVNTEASGTHELGSKL